MKRWRVVESTGVATKFPVRSGKSSNNRESLNLLWGLDPWGLDP